MIYPMVKHADWEPNLRTKKILKLKQAVNEMERDVVQIARQIEDHYNEIEKLADEQKHVRNEIRRVDALVADLESGKTRTIQKEVDVFQDGTTSYRRRKTTGSPKRGIRKSAPPRGAATKKRKRRV